MSDILNKSLTNNAAGGTTTFTTLNRFSVGTLTNPGFTVAFVRIRLRPTTTAGNPFVFDNWYIGHRDNAGEVWDFVGDQVRITFGGQNGITLTPNTADVWSDVIAFALDVTKDVIIAYDGPAGTSRSVRNMPSGTFTGINLHFKSNVQEASLTNKASYGTSNGRLDMINLIEVFADDSSSLAAESSSDFVLEHSSEWASSDRAQHQRDSSDKAVFDAASSDRVLSEAHSSDEAASSDKALHDAKSSDDLLSEQHSSDEAASSDHEAKSSDDALSEQASSDRNAGGQGSSSDQLLSERVSSDIAQHERDSSDKAAHDAKSSDDALSSDHELFEQASSSDQLLSEQVSSDIAQHERDSSDFNADHAGSSSSNKLLHDAQSSEFQSDQTNAPLVGPIQTIVTVTV